MLPVVIWLEGWFEWWLRMPAAAILLAAFWQALPGFWMVSVRPRTVVLLAIALAWVMATAASGVFDVNNFDWTKHRAMFPDLSRGTWPAYSPPRLSGLSAYSSGEVALTGSLLRYYVAWSIMPGSVGKWIGVAALNWAVPNRAWCGVALMMLMFTCGYRGWKVVAAASIFILFGGVDVVTRVLFDG